MTVRPIKAVFTQKFEFEQGCRDISINFVSNPKCVDMVLFVPYSDYMCTKYFYHYLYICTNQYIASKRVELYDIYIKNNKMSA